MNPGKFFTEEAANNVTPFVGVGIETSKMIWSETSVNVTPFVGVWIETLDLSL